MTATLSNLATLDTSAPSISIDTIHTAMLAAVAHFAAEACVRDVDSAARQPVSMGAAFADLCHALRIPTPAVVLHALD